jgi:hypothetical protein
MHRETSDSPRILCDPSAVVEIALGCRSGGRRLLDRKPRTPPYFWRLHASVRRRPRLKWGGVRGFELILGNLMAQRARNAVCGKSVCVLLGIERQMSEDLPFVAGHLCLKASHGHMADAAFVFNRRARLSAVGLPPGHFLQGRAGSQTRLAQRTLWIGANHPGQGDK